MNLFHRFFNKNWEFSFPLFFRFAQNHGPSNPNVEGTLRRVREDYERKLSDLQSRLKKFQAAQQEHAKLLKSQSDSERQLKSLKNDLLDMKRNKVRRRRPVG
jgi:hypothetical protein